MVSQLHNPSHLHSRNNHTGIGVEDREGVIGRTAAHRHSCTAVQDISTFRTASAGHTRVSVGKSGIATCEPALGCVKMRCPGHVCPEFVEVGLLARRHMFEYKRVSVYANSQVVTASL